jgi:hypothetical protein
MHLESRSAGEDAAAYSIHSAELLAPSLPWVWAWVAACESELALWRHQSAQRYCTMCWGLAWDLMRCGSEMWACCEDEMGLTIKGSK